MDYQLFFNLLIGVITVGLGWFMRSVFETIRDLRRNDDGLGERITSLAVSLPENYVHKNDFRELNDRIFDKLDRIESKLDQKADK